MLFGQSVFQSVVARLEREAEDVAVEAPAFTARPFSPGTLFETAKQDVEPANRPLEFYLDLLDDVPKPAEPETMPEYLGRTSLSDVSDELAISEKDTLESLSEKRRAFARLNHPDTVSPAFRHNANLRMTAANLLIDQAIRLLGK
ncbi:hypothetical protein [Agrobacterium larrymoorei]|uniref:J domain-containing protein n=1 Tax=Agrobacterium larrymoorei TaxID=160699 RepID=A0AAF0H9A5_9HYPH|nr:hypothetical protein [Agrobacterium larrymoorei]WHA41933.1 hypothetical protein CFBP5477_004700 [Agrobacterium larrymoorei]